MQKTTLIALALCAGLLGACTEEKAKVTEPTPPAKQAAAATTPAAQPDDDIDVPKHLNAFDAARYKNQVKRERAEAARLASLPKADSNVPLSAYRMIEEPKVISLLFLGLLGGEPELKMLQQIYDPTYYQEKDDFKMRDRINAFMPTAKAELAEVQKNRYNAMKITLNLGPYDFEKKAFSLGALSREGNGFSLENAGAYVTFLNGKDYGWLPVADETEARRIEALRKDYTPHPQIRGVTAQDFTATVYFFVAGARKSERLNELESQLTRVEIHDWEGTLVGTL